MEQWGITDCGKLRADNQDVFKILFDEEKKISILVVCDGIGGARAGNVASALAADAFMQSMGRYVENIGSIDDTADRMSQAVSTANKVVHEKSLQGDDYAGMGTTLTAAVSTFEGEVVVNIGDSRAYHITRDAIKQVTKDHTVVEELIARGEISRDQGREHPSKHLITRALGSYRTELPDVFYLSLEPGDFILLCTDGLTDVITDEEILSQLKRKTSVQESCESLLELALSRGAPDNVTVAVFKK